MHQTPPADPRSATADTEPVPPHRPRTSFYLTVGCLSVIAGLVLGVGGFFGVRAIQGDGGGSTAGEERTDGSEGEPTVLDETPAGPDAAVPFGSTFPMHSQTLEGDVDVTFVEMNWDATEEIAAANSLNDPPGEGNRYLMLTVEGVYHGSGTPDPVLGSWMGATYVTEDGTEYSRVHLVTPNYDDLVERQGAGDGDTFRAEMPFEVPAEIEGGGHLVLHQGTQAVDEGVWVEAG